MGRWILRYLNATGAYRCCFCRFCYRIRVRLQGVAAFAGMAEMGSVPAGAQIKIYAPSFWSCHSNGLLHARSGAERNAPWSNTPLFPRERGKRAALKLDAGLVTCLIATDHGHWSIVRQGSLQRLPLRPWRAHQYIALFSDGQCPSAPASSRLLLTGDAVGVTVVLEILRARIGRGRP